MNKSCLGFVDGCVPRARGCWIAEDCLASRGESCKSELASYVVANFSPAVAELCVLYRQTEEGMVSELIAFCTSTGKSCLTAEILNSFEHEVRANVS